MAWSCASYQPPRFAILHIEQRGSLNGNGLRFVVMPDPGAMQLEVAMRYDVGSSDDPDGKAGLAHLVEHLMFDIKPQGDTHSVDHYIGRIATLRNAYTKYEDTHYYTIIQPGDLDTMLQLEAIRLHDGCHSIDEAEFEREREVVRNEIRQRSGTPEGQLDRILASSLYPAGHPYARTIGGDDAQIAGLTLADACAFMDRYYVPERATLIVAGRVDPRTAQAAIEKWFGGLARRAAGPRRPIPEITLAHGRQTVDLDIDRPIVTVSWAIPPIKSSADFYALREYYDRLGGIGGQGALHEFSTRASTMLVGGREAPLLTTVIELEDMSKVDQALDFVWKEVGVGESVADHEKDEPIRLQSTLVVELESLEARVDHIADLVQIDPDEFAAHGALLFHELDTIKKQDLHTFDAKVRRELDPSRARITVFRPSRAGIKGDSRAQFAFHPPEQLSGPADDMSEDATSALEVSAEHDELAGATRFELDNGLHVVMLPVRSALPVVTVKLIFDAGQAAMPDKPLVADATAEFTRPPLEAAYKLYRAGIGIRCGATLDDTVCTARTIGIYLHEAIQGLERKFKDPEIEQRSIEMWQRSVANSGEVRHRAADDEVERQLLGALFGADHPYARARAAAIGAERGVARDTLFAFRDAHFRASNATLVVTGTFDPADAKAAIEEAFGGWLRGTPTGAVPPAAPRSAPAYIGVVRDAGPQMEVAIAYPAPAGIGGEQAARLVLQNMIGDAEQRVRERLGVTYGTQAFRDQRRGPTRYEVHAAVDAARAGEALAAMRSAIDDLRAGKDFERHFVAARRTVAHHLLDRSSMSIDLANELATIAEFGQPADYFQRLLQQVAVTTPADIQKLLAAELPPEHEAVVLSADRDTLVKAFEAAGIKDYKLVEPTLPH